MEKVIAPKGFLCYDENGCKTDRVLQRQLLKRQNKEGFK